MKYEEIMKDFDGSLKQAVTVADAYLADTSTQSRRLAYSKGQGDGYQFISEDNDKKVELLRRARALIRSLASTDIGVELATEISDVIGG